MSFTWPSTLLSAVASKHFMNPDPALMLNAPYDQTIYYLCPLSIPALLVCRLCSDINGQYSSTFEISNNPAMKHLPAAIIICPLCW